MITDLKAYGSLMFFIKDHLGSVRAVVSETGEVQQTNDYYPFGDMFGNSGTSDTSGNRYRFTGKELGNETGLYDFSARFLQTGLERFTTIDPLAEKYPNISPYAYCNGNPVNFVDPDGRAIEEKNKKEWDKLYKIITKTASRVQRRIDKLESKGKTGSRLSYLKDRLSSINETLSTMKKLENSKHTYSLSHANESTGEVTYKNGQIDISYIAGSVPNFVHELTHAGQFESGDIGFHRTEGTVYAQDIFDEIAAYRAQEYYSGGDVSKVTSKDISNITDPDGNPMYRVDGICRTASVPISVNTPYDVVAKAYLVRNITNEKRPFHMVVDMYFNGSKE